MEKLNWKYCQDNSDLILSGGIKTILASSLITNINQVENSYGNYLISYKGVHYYVGEAKEMPKRIKQQYTEKTSIFYKNYLDSRKHYEVGKIPILNFELRILQTQIGRKEIEEFGIVNLPTRLNKFERGKRKKVSMTVNEDIWIEVQILSEKLLAEGEKELLDTDSKVWSINLPSSNAGVYMVRSKKNEILYIGESSDIQERYFTHGSTTYFSALRRHVGTELLGLKFIDDKKRRFTEYDDIRVTQYLKECLYSYMHVNLGRYELEEFLIRKHRPLLNRKENK